jgi:hypothetical protein
MNTRSETGGDGVTDGWRAGEPGIVELPSGRLIRGRGLSRPLPPGPEPTHGLYLLGRRPPETAWPSRWLRWPDFRLPASPEDAHAAFAEALELAGGGRVEVACAGGRGRTGTALACIAVLDGIQATSAVAWVREHYDRHAVETPWQRRYVARFTQPG